MKLPPPIPEDCSQWADSLVFILKISNTLIEVGKVRCDYPERRILQWEGRDTEAHREWASKVGLTITSALGAALYTELRFLPVDVPRWLWDGTCRMWASIFDTASGNPDGAFDDVQIDHTAQTVSVFCWGEAGERNLTVRLRLPRSRWVRTVCPSSYQIDTPFDDLKHSDTAYRGTV